ncbi:MAG: ribonuclease HI family protein [Vallitaleaceae bacterium]|nr:ribonuclease HI family protein [Vallitaleaceae bacterium]
MIYEASFDGSAKPNPGEMKVGGLIKLKETGEIIHEYSEEIGKGTNNEAEYTSLLKLLDEVLERNIESIIIYGDSALVVNQVNLAWKAKDDRMKALRNQARQMLSLIPEWKLEHVLRGKNQEADSLTR